MKLQTHISTILESVSIPNCFGSRDHQRSDRGCVDGRPGAGSHLDRSGTRIRLQGRVLATLVRNCRPTRMLLSDWFSRLGIPQGVATYRD